MAGARKNVKGRAYVLLRDDAALKVLTRATSADLRVYQAFGGKERTVTSTFPAFVSIWPILESEPALDRVTHRIQVSAYSKSLDLCHDCADRFDAVLNGQTFGATGWTDVSVTHKGTNTSYDPDEGVWNLAYDIEVKVSS